MLKTLIKARGSSACFLFYNLTAKSYFMNKSSFFTTGIFERINAITKLDTKALPQVSQEINLYRNRGP